MGQVEAAFTEASERYIIGFEVEGLLHWLHRRAEHIDLLAVEGTDRLEDETFGDGQGDLLVEDTVGHDIRLHAEFATKVFFVILHTLIHTSPEKGRPVEVGLTTLSAQDVLRIERGHRLADGLTVFRSLPLSLIHGFLQLLLRAQVGDAVIVDGKLQGVEDVILAGVGLAPGEDAL